MASLGLVSLGAANDGCRPIFFLKTSDDLSLVIASESDDLVLAVVSSPLPFSHVVYPVLFLNSATKNKL